MNSPLIHAVCGSDIRRLFLSESRLSVCTSRLRASRESGGGVALKVKCALCRQLQHILYPCVSTACIPLVVWGKWADFVKQANVKISWETAYSMSVTHSIWVCSCIWEHKDSFLWHTYNQVFQLKHSNSIHATSFINMWWERKSPKTPIGRGIVSLLKSSQMEGANFRASVKCLMKEVSSSAASFRAAY